MWGKKKREPPNVTKEQSHMMLELHNVMIEPTNVRENKGTTECDKSTVIWDVGTTQCKDGMVKSEEKKPPNLTKNCQIWC